MVRVTIRTSWVVNFTLFRCYRPVIYTRPKLPPAHHSTTLSGVSSISLQLRHVSTIGKKTKQQYLLHVFTISHYIVNFGLLTAEIGSGVWGTPANFNGFRVLPLLLQRCRSPEANQTSHNVWLSLLGWYTVCTFSGALAR